MKTQTLLSVLAFGLIVNAFSQKPTMELTFTADNNGQYVPLDSIFIENLTQEGDTTLYAPDTVLSVEYSTGVNDMDFTENSFSVTQNYPNPFNDQTIINIYLPDKEMIEIVITDIVGRELVQYKNRLIRGIHSFTFYPGNENYYLFTVMGDNTSKTIKMLHANSNLTISGMCHMDYTSYSENLLPTKSQNALNDFIFNLDDELSLVGYYESGESSFIDSPMTSQIYTFQFGNDYSCPGTPTVSYEGKVYNTVLIGSQCWLKENLNVGTLITTVTPQEDNGIIEKYCQWDMEEYCDTYGGLYEWREMMQFETTQGGQGICPTGWHIPDDEEWKILEGTVDSQFGVGNPVWNERGMRGFDAGLNLKTTDGWYPGGNGNDSFGFSLLPGGYISNSGSPFGDYENTYLWTSTEISFFDAYYRSIFEYSPEIIRAVRDKLYSHSVRCLKD